MVRVEPVGGAALSGQGPQGPGGGDGTGGAGEHADGLAETLLRQVLETAVAVAREGEEDKPAIPAPAAMRPYLRFSKLRGPALAAVRRVLDADEEFRSRVAAAADEAAVGRAGWLFLSRPDGWQAELDAIVTTAAEEAGQEADRRAENDARRRLAGAEEAVRRAEQAAEGARREAAQAGSALADERRARLAATAELAAVHQRLESLTAERERVRASATAAASEAGQLRRRVAELEARVKELEGEAAAAAAAAAGAAEAAASAKGAASERAQAAPGTAAGGSGDAGEGGVVGGAGGGLGAEVVADIGRALREAAGAASRLAEALAAAAQPLAPAEAPSADTETPQAGAEAAPAPARRRVLPPARRPVRLPPATFDDSMEAAEHLVRVDGVALVVDGYNVSQTGWPELALAEQRRRLVSALGELAARTGADVRVVFDGADLAMPGAVPTTSQLVRVSFSPPGVEADDEVLAMVKALPVHRAVVVATSDREVQEGAARAGANVISSPQLLALLGRWAAGP